MLNIDEFKNPSKVVFYLISLTVCVGFLLRILPIDNFLPFAAMVFAYYFTRSSPNGNGDKIK